MDAITKKFVEDWGEDCYRRVLAAAEMHATEANSGKWNHQLKHALLICIGYQCMELPDYQTFHGFVGLDWPKMKQWIKDHAQLDSYQGDVDYLSLVAGAYNEYMPSKQEAEAT